jgi:hypothetical protein
MEATIRKKMDEAETAIGPMRPLLPGHSGESTTKAPAPSSVAERIRGALSRWISLPSLQYTAGIEPQAVRVAAVASEQSRFLALCSIHGRFVLLASNGGRITDDPATVLDALLRSEGSTINPAREKVEASMRSVENYILGERTVGPAAEMAAVAHARRAALQRLSATIERARPHTRSQLVRLGAAARCAILGRMGSAAEAELRRIALLETPDEEWLASVVAVDSPHQPDSVADERHRIVAVLLL